MAIDTARYARKKRDADNRTGFQVDNARDLSRALRDIDADLEEKRKTRADEARQKRLDDERTSDTRYERERDRTLKVDQRDDRAALAEDRRAQAEQRRQQLAGEGLNQASEELAGRARGGASYDDLRRIAQDDPRMANVDDSFVAAIRDGSVEAQRAEREKIDTARAESAAKLKTMDEQAKAAARRGVVRPKSAQQIEDEETTRRKAKADADAAEARARAAQAKGSPDETSNVRASEKLRKEYNALGPVKAALDSQASYETMVNASKDPSAAGDLSLIFSFMKVLDPGSVVKETEFANAQNAAGVPDRIRNSFNKVLSGERLSAEQRADFLRQAKGLADQAAARAKTETERYTGIAERSGFSPADVVRGGKAPEAAPADDIDAELDAVNKRIKELEAQQ